MNGMYKQRHRMAWTVNAITWVFIVVVALRLAMTA